MPIILKSDTYQIIEIKKKTSSKFFKNLQLGSLLKFEVELKHVGSGDHGTYITATNINTKETINKTFNQMARLLENFELVKANSYQGLQLEPTEKEIFGYTE